MTERLNKELGKLLEGYDARRRAALDHEQQVKAEDKAFVERFAELRRSVIRPVFEAAVAMMAQRGLECRITEHELASEGSGKINEAGITLHVTTSEVKQAAHNDAQARMLSFTTRHYNKTVWINVGEARGAGGIAGNAGACQLAQIDTQLVEERMLEFVAAVVKG